MFSMVMLQLRMVDLCFNRQASGPRTRAVSASALFCMYVSRIKALITSQVLYPLSAVVTACVCPPPPPPPLPSLLRL
jgi:hypothetical protein